MPLLFRQRTAGYILCLWHVQEDTPALASRCLPDEVRRAEAFTSEKRRREWLAWRALLQDILPGAVVDYTPDGAPALKDSASVLGVDAAELRDGSPRGEYKCLSVSHSIDMVAVMVADRPCGVDIETYNRNFSRVASKYIADAERRYLIPDTSCSYARLWCAKEALYKWAGIPGVNLRDEVTVTFADPLLPAESVSPSDPFSGADCLVGEIHSPTYFTSAAAADCTSAVPAAPISPTDFAAAGTGHTGRMTGEVKGRKAMLRYLFLPAHCLAWCVGVEAEE